jgi:hypothetical protein
MITPVLRIKTIVAVGLVAAAVPGIAAADTPTPDPTTNFQLSQATTSACDDSPLTAACLSAASADIDTARAVEGIGPITLPTGFAALTVPQQLLVLANLERVDRGENPVLGLTSTLDGNAQTGANSDADPPFPAPFPGSYGTGNWAGGYASTLEADFGWMYDDGLGSPNLECTAADQMHCWGHRHDVIETQLVAPLVMGAAEATNTQFSPSMAELFIGGDSEAPIPSLTWAMLSTQLPVGVSATSLTLPGGGASGQLTIWASGENMNVGAAATAGWSVSPAGCSLLAGKTCKLTVSVTPAGLGTAGTLTLTGPNGPQTVALQSQVATALTLAASKAAIVAGGSVTLTGKLSTATGAPVTGQVVTLSPGGPSARTGPGGTVSFTESPTANVGYHAAFAGTGGLGASNSSALSVAVAPKIKLSVKHSGGEAKLSGTVTPAAPRSHVKLERHRGHGWAVVASAKQSHAGKFKFAIGRSGRYRVVTPADRAHAAGVSAAISL